MLQGLNFFDTMPFGKIRKSCPARLIRIKNSLYQSATRLPTPSGNHIDSSHCHYCNSNRTNPIYAGLFQLPPRGKNTSPRVTRLKA